MKTRTIIFFFCLLWVSNHLVAMNFLYEGDHEVSRWERLDKPLKTPSDKVVATFGGFVKTDAFWDSRQVEALREGHFLFFPKNKLLDVHNNDINSQGDFNILAIQTRVFGRVDGPKIGDARASGLVEADFFGVSDPTINSVRMRHAKSRLDWKHFACVTGYTYSPMFVEDCFPLTISFNTGAPFESFTRNPQVRVECMLNDSAVITLAALSEIDFKSTGTFGPSSEYIRNAQVPILHAQAEVHSGEQLFGAGVDFRTLRPRLASTKNVKVDEILHSVCAIAYAKLVLDEFSIAAKVIYAANAFSYLMLGGYGIKAVDPVTEERDYTNISNISAWLDMNYGHKKQIGIFLGIAKNLGADDCLAPLAGVSGATSFEDLIFGRGVNIDWMYRISPRILMMFKNFHVAAEFEITTAYYGIVQQSGKVECTHPETNYRLLLATYYHF